MDPKAKELIIKILISLFKGVSMVVLTAALVFAAFYFDNKFTLGESETETSDSPQEADCNVAGISIRGSIVTYHPNDAYVDDKLAMDETSADEIKYYVEESEKNENIKAMIVEIDSGGGSPVGGEEMMEAFRQAKKPVIVLVRDIAASAAYLAATGGDKIFASKWSDIGSIGVTYSYLDYSEQNKKEGIKFIELSSGPYKDAGNPDRALTDADKALYQRDIAIGRQHFINLVAQNRKLKIEDVAKLADGSTVMGEAALKAGLIDSIGSIYDVKNYIQEEISDEPEICWQN